MKITLLISLFFITASSKAQQDSLASGVYNLGNIKKEGQAKPKLQGRTTDLIKLSFHAATLAPGKINHPPRALNDVEELILVKNGQLKITINDSSKVLGPGSIALIVAGDTQNFRNASDKPVTYYVLGFKSMSPVNISRGKTSGGTLLKDWNELAVKKTAKGESRQVFDRPSSMFERFEVHATTLNAGEESHAPHKHRAEEIMLIMKGKVTMNISGENFKADTGSMILIRPNILHNLKNSGNEQCWYYAIKWYNTTGE